MLWVYFEEFYWAWSYGEQGKIGVFSFELQLWLLLMNFSFQFSVDCYKQFFFWLWYLSSFYKPNSVAVILYIVSYPKQPNAIFRQLGTPPLLPPTTQRQSSFDNWIDWIKKDLISPNSQCYDYYFQKPSTETKMTTPPPPQPRLVTTTSSKPQPQRPNTTTNKNQKKWHHTITLDLLLTVLNRTLLHPWFAWTAVLSLRAQATPYTDRSFILATAYAALLTLFAIARAVNHRVAHGLPRPVDLSEEVVVVTGGASGLGLLVARIYGLRGVAVAVLDVRDVAEVEGWEEGSGVEYYQCDIGSRREVEVAMGRIKKDVCFSTFIGFLWKIYILCYVSFDMCKVLTD